MQRLLTRGHTSYAHQLGLSGWAECQIDAHHTLDRAREAKTHETTLPVQRRPLQIKLTANISMLRREPGRTTVVQPMEFDPTKKNAIWPLACHIRGARGTNGPDAPPNRLRAGICNRRILAGAHRMLEALSV